MSDTLEPRVVDKPFVRRWLLTTLTLTGRAPVRFGCLIALLGLLDTGVEALFEGYSVSRVWGDRLGALALPVLWLLTAAAARGADKPSLTREAFVSAFKRGSLLRALRAGALYAIAIHLFDAWHATGSSATAHHVGTAPGYLTVPGDFIDSIAVNAGFFSIALGPCYFPLLAFVPGAEAYLLSRNACRKNGELVIDMLIAVLVITGIGITNVLPAFGITNAAFLVFMGVFNYVVYRDIFERRAENAPLPAHTSDPVIAAVVPSPEAGQ